jgi:hypothetical protein
MALADVLGALPAVTAHAGDAQGMTVVFHCADCQGEYVEIEQHLQLAHGMSAEDAVTYAAFVMGGPRDVRQIQKKRVD